MANIRQTPAGTFKVQIRRLGFPTQIQTFPTRKAAQTWAARVEADMKHGHFIPIDRDGLSMTVAKLIERYKDDKVKAGAPLKKGAVSCMSIIANSKLGAMPVNRVTTNAVTQFAEMRRRAVKPQTVAKNVAYLSALFNYANSKLKLNIGNPVREVSMALKAANTIGKSAERTRRPSDDELAALRQYLAPKGKTRPRRVPMVEIVDFAIATTMRAGEIVSIRWSDLNDDRREILIRARKDPKNKATNDQMAPLLPDAMAIIARQPRIEGEDRIFPHGLHAISTLFFRACQALNIIDLRFHDLRHEGISRLFELHMSVADVAKFSGHKDWKSLKRYEQMSNASIHHRYELLVAQFGRRPATKYVADEEAA
ncbi:integrase family protein [Caballeronia calidae]|uniref:Integrase family protein n=1 Tax=Caballeronia calidae TaxID=1777139 RepID=A0A158EFM2_9BURK|nr:site-specific integrase [Caballeronia calidae]SAL05500.1 integrase family protein [Caballeronia calidae]